MINAFIGYDGKAREVKRIYVGVNNIARSCDRVYAGVNGVAELVTETLVPIPTISGTYTYNGQEQEVQINNLNKYDVVVNGVTKETHATITHEITFSLRSRFATWTDGTTADKTASWVINRQVIGKPTYNGTTKTYDGTVQTVSKSDFDFGSYDSDLYDFSCGSYTNAGTYTYTMSTVPVTVDGQTIYDYQYSDGTTSYTGTWTINKINVTIQFQQFTAYINYGTVYPGSYLVYYAGESTGRAIHCNVTTDRASLGDSNITITNNSDNTFNYRVTEEIYSSEYITENIVISLADTTNYSGSSVSRTVYYGKE